MLLKGISQKGKNRIRELGASWTLIREAGSVFFSEDRGPWGLIKPDAAGAEKSRWINLRRDRDFEILER